VDWKEGDGSNVGDLKLSKIQWAENINQFEGSQHHHLKTTPKKKNSSEDLQQDATPEKNEEEVKTMPKIDTHRKSHPAKPAIKKTIPPPVTEKIIELP